MAAPRSPERKSTNTPNSRSSFWCGLGACSRLEYRWITASPWRHSSAPVPIASLWPCHSISRQSGSRRSLSSESSTSFCPACTIDLKLAISVDPAIDRAVFQGVDVAVVTGDEVGPAVGRNGVFGCRVNVDARHFDCLLLGFLLAVNILQPVPRLPLWFFALDVVLHDGVERFDTNWVFDALVAILFEEHGIVVFHVTFLNHLVEQVFVIEAADLILPFLVRVADGVAEAFLVYMLAQPIL